MESVTHHHPSASLRTDHTSTQPGHKNPWEGRGFTTFSLPSSRTHWCASFSLAPSPRALTNQGLPVSQSARVAPSLAVPSVALAWEDQLVPGPG